MKVHISYEPLINLLAPRKAPELALIDESDTMLDPWVEFPRPTSGIFLRARPGTLPLPDVPETPPDED